MKGLRLVTVAGLVALVMCIGIFFVGRASVTLGEEFSGTVEVVNGNQTAISVRSEDGTMLTGPLAYAPGTPLRHGQQVTGRYFADPNIVFVSTEN